MDAMLKISAVIMTTSVFAGLLISGPSGLTSTVSATGSEIAAVKVRTVVVRPTKAPTRTASFELPSERPGRTRFLRRPAISTKGRGLGHA